MERKLEIEITNLYGSAEFPRQTTVLKPKMSRKKKRTTTKSDTAISISSETEEQKSEESKENVNSFNILNDKPAVRLGGAYGKLSGLLKEAGMTLATVGEEDFTKTGTQTIVKTITILPEYSELDLDGNEIKEIKGLVSVNAMFGGKCSQKPTIWDVIPKCRTNIKLIYPDAFDTKVVKMLRMAENLNFAERRRARIKIISGI